MQITLSQFARTHTWGPTVEAVTLSAALALVINATPLAPVLILFWLPIFLIGMAPVIAATEMVTLILGHGLPVDRAHAAFRRTVAVLAGVGTATYLVGAEPWTYLQSTPSF